MDRDDRDEAVELTGVVLEEPGSVTVYMTHYRAASDVYEGENTNRITHAHPCCKNMVYALEGY